MVEATIEDRDEDEGKEDHEDEVTNEDVISAVAHGLPHLCGAHRQVALGHGGGVAGVLTLLVIHHFCIVDFVTSFEFIESRNIPEDRGDNDREDEKVTGVCQGP